MSYQVRAYLVPAESCFELYVLAPAECLGLGEDRVDGQVSLVLWFLVNTAHVLVLSRFRLLETGEPLPPGTGMYRGTAQQPRGGQGFVTVHCFDWLPEAE